MLIIRGVAGFFLGLACAAAGVYLAEMLPIAYRGRFMLGVNIGYTAFAVCMVYFNSLADLRVFLAFTACPAALATALFLCLPESPRYLARRSGCGW